MGFDSFKSLGKQTGGDLALPMWIDFMKTALADVPEESFQQPEGLTATRIDPKSGMLAGRGENAGVMEFFPSDKVPKKRAVPKPAKRKPKPEEGSDGFSDFGGSSRSSGRSSGGSTRSIESLF
jgi:penicillin-binding protein 1A